MTVERVVEDLVDVDYSKCITVMTGLKLSKLTRKGKLY